MTNRQLIEDQSHHGLNSRYNTAAHIEHPASCHIASSSQKCCKLWMPSLFTVERMETGETRQWPKVTVPLGTMIMFKHLLLHHSSYLRQETVERGSRGRREALGKWSDSAGGTLITELGQSEEKWREGWVWRQSLTATSKDTGARSSLSFDSSYHTQHELEAYIPFLSGERWHNQAQTWLPW